MVLKNEAIIFAFLHLCCLLGRSSLQASSTWTTQNVKVPVFQHLRAALDLERNVIIFHLSMQTKKSCVERAFCSSRPSKQLRGLALIFIKDADVPRAPCKQRKLQQGLTLLSWCGHVVFIHISTLPSWGQRGAPGRSPPWCRIQQSHANCIRESI